MKNLGKIILLAFSLASCVGNVEDGASKILPKTYRGYRNKLIEFGEIKLDKMRCIYAEYDIDSDGKADVIELYGMKKEDEIEDEPFAYGFDWNDNNSIECDEILIDREMDGINGNEKRITPEDCGDKLNFI